MGSTGGGHLAKMATNFIKMVKPVFFLSKGWRRGASKILRKDKANFCSVGESPSQSLVPPAPSPLEETLDILIQSLKI